MALSVRVCALLALVLLAATSWCQEPPEPLDAEAEAEALARTLDEASQRWLEAVSARPDSPDLAAFAGWLRNRADIASADVQGDTVVTHTPDGVMVLFDDPPAELDGSPAVVTRLSEVGAGSCSAAPRVHGAILPPVLAANGVLARPRCLGDLVPKGDALLIQAHLEDHYDATPELEKILDHAGFHVLTYAPTTVETFLSMSSASVVVVLSHGSIGEHNGEKHYRVCTALHQPMLTRQLKEAGRWLKKGELFLNCRIRRDENTNKPVSALKWIHIWDTWFEKNLPRLVNNAAVLFLTCRSGDLDSTARIFLDKGASAYFGFEGSVRAEWLSDWGACLLDRVTGANQHSPHDVQPFRRPQSFKDAYDYIRRQPSYEQCVGSGGKAKLSLTWGDIDPTFSAHPHIDYASITPVPESTDYELDIDGAFGHKDECRVLVGDRELPFTAIGGEGAPLRASLPGDATGDLVVEMKDGRRSNPVTISEFSASVALEQDDPWCAGTINLRYRALVIGTRLYHSTDPNSIMRFAGWPDEAPNQLFHALVTPNADWEVEWDYNSTKRVGATTFKAEGTGTAAGRGPAEDEHAPEGSVGVTVEPPMAPRDDHSSTAKVWAAARGGPVRFTTQTAFGGFTQEVPVHAVGLPWVEVDYNHLRGVLPPITAQGTYCRWQMDEVTLEPPPQDLEKQARLLDPVRLARWLSASLTGNWNPAVHSP